MPRIPDPHRSPDAARNLSSVGAGGADDRDALRCIPPLGGAGVPVFLLQHLLAFAVGPEMVWGALAARSIDGALEDGGA